jgi:hypothetical protein
MRELPMIKRQVKDTKILNIIKAGLQTLNRIKPMYIVPVIWPVAFGDTIILLQHIKHIAQKEEVVLICPLNRPDLKELLDLCSTWVSGVIDITLLEEERDRMNSLGLINPLGYLNISLQEFIIKELLEGYQSFDVYPTIIKLRYLPFLFGMENYSDTIGYGERIWEKRAQMWLENKKELPKLVKQLAEKKNKIVVHFREGRYGDSEARDIPYAYSQDLVNKLHEKYPDYEIVRLGDASMTLLDNCTNHSHNNLSVAEQIKEIQEAKLFIGCHSAPQMLAVATSDTPVICIGYTAQETTTTMQDSVARLSYEPIGKQVEKIFYQRMFDANGQELIPSQNNPHRKSLEMVDIDEIMTEVTRILN